MNIKVYLIKEENLKLDFSIIISNFSYTMENDRRIYWNPENCGTYGIINISVDKNQGDFNIENIIRDRLNNGNLKSMSEIKLIFNNQFNKCGELLKDEFNTKNKIIEYQKRVYGINIENC